MIIYRFLKEIYKCFIYASLFKPVIIQISPPLINFVYGGQRLKADKFPALVE